MRVHGRKRELCGSNEWEATDADGKYQKREMIDVAMRRGSGWVDYRWQNPGTGQIEPKSTYVERWGDYIVGCGIYGAEGERKAAMTVPQLSLRQPRALPQ